MSGVSKDSGAGSVRAQLNSREMSLAQWEVVFLCTAINMLDGYDVLVMSFAAAPVASDWRLDPASLGLLLSAGLIGMGLGSIMLGSLADALGRTNANLGYAYGAFATPPHCRSLCHALHAKGLAHQPAASSSSSA